MQFDILSFPQKENPEICSYQLSDIRFTGVQGMPVISVFIKNAVHPNLFILQEGKENQGSKLVIKIIINNI